ncbi:MAG: hypothetical protein WC451_03925 [Patescibacteria group bacterium]
MGQGCDCSSCPGCASDEPKVEETGKCPKCGCEPCKCEGTEDDEKEPKAE